MPRVLDAAPVAAPREEAKAPPPQPVFMGNAATASILATGNLPGAAIPVGAGNAATVHAFGATPTPAPAATPAATPAPATTTAPAATAAPTPTFPSGPTISTPGTPPSGPAPSSRGYNLEFVIDNQPKSYPGLTEAQTIETLRRTWRRLHDLLDVYRGWLLALTENREEHWVTGFWSDTFGGVSLPEIDDFNAIGRGPLSEAMAELNRSQADLEQAYDASGNRNLPPELERSPLMQQARLDLIAEQHVRRAVDHLQDGANQIQERRQAVQKYMEGTISGAETGITVCKVSIAVLTTAAGGEAFAMARTAGMGLTASGFAAGGTAATLEYVNQTATQVGQMRIGEREWGDFDVQAILKAGGKSAVVNFVGAVVGGKFAETVGARFVAWLGPRLPGMGLPQTAARLGGRMILNWIGGELASPFTTTAGVLMDRALQGEFTVTSWGDFCDHVWTDMANSAKMNAFFAAFGAAHAEFTVTSNGVPRPIVDEPGGPHVVPSDGVPVPVRDLPGGPHIVPSDGVPVPITDAPALPRTPAGPSGSTGSGSTGGGSSGGSPGRGGSGGGSSGGAGSRTQPDLGDTLPGVDAHRPTVPAGPSTAVDPATVVDPGTLPGMGRAGPGRTTTLPGLGPMGPAPVGPGAPVVLVIADRVVASQLLGDVVVAGRPFRLLQGADPAYPRQVWNQEFGQAGDPPPAWVGADGRLVVNGAQVPAPLRASDILSGPLRQGPLMTPASGERFGSPTIGGAGRDLPMIEHLDTARWRYVRTLGAQGGINESEIWVDPEGRPWLLKPAAGESNMGFGPDVGIVAGERWRRALAASYLADSLGIETPGVRLVRLDNRIGSLQEWRPGMLQVGRELSYRSEAFMDFFASQDRLDLDAFDVLIGNQDRHLGNILIRIGPNGPEGLPIDQDASAPAGEQRTTFPPRVVAPFQRPLPAQVSAEVALGLRRLAGQFPEATLRQWLTQVEVDGIRARLDRIIADLDAGRLLIVP